MKREIKFRAWANGKMHYLSERDKTWLLITSSGYVSIQESDVFDEGGEESNNNNLEADDFNLMQFTGLLDKNGKEIYEGDIVQVRTEFYNIHSEEQDHDKTYTGEVVLIPSKGMCLKNPKWYCWITDTNGKDKRYKSFSAYKSEVIGNIHVVTKNR